MKGNVLVGQSGGPTAVINSSLAGVFKTAMERGYSKVYGMRYGIQGFMDEQYVDLSEHIKNELDLELLKRTPSAFLGTCRYKLPEIHEDKSVYERIFELLDKLDIEVFIYIGGNDSMDTIRKLSDYSLLTGAKQKFVGCPKTIDNDLAITDHTPGFGSAAKYIATSTKEIICDAMGFSYKKKNVNIVEIMGRNAGWLTGAAALSRSEDCEGPDLIYLPELPFSIENFVEEVKKLLEKKDVVVAVVSEGIKTEEGKYVCEYATSSTTTDAFGHIQMSGTASYLASVIKNQLGCKTRAVELSTLQRAAAHLASKIDVDEAFNVGGATVKAADEGSTGVMVVIDRVSDDPYQSATGVYDVHRIANDEKVVPRKWINKAGNYVTEEFLDYVRPLIQGNYAPVMVEGLPRHLNIHLKNYDWSAPRGK
ncbi:MAG: 6-phosphofructokinase [Clostridia bacterium]|nr:6-phosphofructokinase [Clostridia bacterium]MBR4359955.1 6-phosphofructokinase [Clostridia bacterium]